MPKTKMTEDERAAHRAAKREEAEHQLDQLLSADGFKTWMRLRRTVHKYNWTNQVLLTMQALDRGHEYLLAKPAPIWKRDGYHPAKGSHAMYVWVYASHRRKDNTWTCCEKARTERVCPDCGRPDHHFRLGPVFNAPDVRSFETGEAPEPPDFNGTPIEGDDLEHLIEPLADHALDAGWIAEAHLDEITSHGEGGSWDPIRKRQAERARDTLHVYRLLDV